MSSTAKGKCSYRQRVNSIASLELAINTLRNMFAEHKHVFMSINDIRSLAQNALAEVWYKDIADYRGDITPLEVKRECKVNYGIGILRREKEHNWIFRRTIDGLSYEEQLKASDFLVKTSEMSPVQMQEFLNCMEVDYPWLESIKKHRKTKV